MMSSCTLSSSQRGLTLPLGNTPRAGAVECGAETQLGIATAP
jgi:hypothetical protein